MIEISEPAPATTPAAATVYAERMAVLRDTEARLERQHLRLGYIRLAFALAALVLLVPPNPVVIVPALAFGIAARAHGRVLRELAATRRALGFHARSTARVNDQWSTLETPQPEVDTAHSLYAQDLDLFGKGGLFTLLCEARTTLGRNTLAQWLLEPAPAPELLERQSAVAELRRLLDLREAFASAPGPATTPVHREGLRTWVTLASPLPRVFLWAAPLLVLLTALAAWRFAVAHSPLLLTGMLIVDASLTFHYQRSLTPLFREAERANRSLRTVAVLLRHIEHGHFRSEPLRRRVEPLNRLPIPASLALARLGTLAQWTDARRNYLVRILDAPFLFSLQLGLALDRWRLQFGPELQVWLATLAEFEALLCLAGYSFEHPEDPFPEILDEAAIEQAQFVATGLGHPLLPASTCIRNDVALGATTKLLLVSGSNMSGKSTLLRSVGVNVVLAFAGAPVRARSLALTPLTLTASIHVNDSLQAGHSRFYTEILRLRGITEAAHHRPPTLFLIDELLAGTNSSDRLAGTRGLVHDLLRSLAIGMVSTHDLALTTLGQETSRSVRNMHFQDEILDGALRFDYTLREGPVQRSNGLALMRLIGLDV